jgi:2-polyprenyl-6-methoxyphenol hydroxylase-like FAD-dependent oxidoreductase
MNAEVTDLIQEDGAVRGIRYRTASGEHDVRSLLVVGADGRSSRTREAIHLPRVTASPPMDVFWFRLSRRPDDPGDVNAMAGPGHFLVFFDRGEYWQVAYAIPKGGAADVRAAGLEAFRREIVALASQFADRVAELQDWDQVKLLTVQADRLRRWYADGYIAIGDAAHAMSPVGGVGINVAIQDAVAAANVLWDPLRQGRVRTRDLAAVQRRRDLPVRVMQAVQGVIQDRLLRTVLAARDNSPSIPLFLRVAFGTPGLRGLMPRLIAFGLFRPHVESPALPPVAPLSGTVAVGGARSAGPVP